MQRWHGGAIAGVVALMLAASAGSASAAALTSSNVTTPANPFYALVNSDSPGTFDLEGTTNATGSGNKTNVVCQGSSPAGFQVLNDFALDNTTNAVTKPDAPLPQISGPTACILEALPDGQSNGDVPGTSSPHFTGPTAYLATVGHDNFAQPPNTAKVQDVIAGTQKPNAAWSVSSTGDCSVYDSWLTNPLTLEAGPDLFYCNAFLWYSNKGETQDGTRSQLKVDGVNAYLSDGLGGVSPTAPHLPSLVSDYHYDDTNGDLTLHTVEPVVRCTSGDLFDSSTKDCPDVEPTGVQLETFMSVNGSPIGTAQVLQRFDSTDGGTHHLDTLFDNEEWVGGTHNGGIRFPWVNSDFTSFGEGANVPAPPSGAGSIFAKHDVSEPNGTIDGIQGAMTYAQAPETIHFISPTNSSSNQYADFELGYHRTVSPTVPSWFGWKFAIADNPTDVASAAAAAEASFSPPTIAITGPANGSTLPTSSAHVTGTSGDAATVDVNGHAANLAGDGTWSVDVPLSGGTNTLTATATNRFGTSRSAAVSVHFNPPASGGHSFRGAAFKGAHSLRLDRHGRAIFKVFCPADSTPSCSGTLAVATAGKVIVPAGKATAAKRKARVIKLGSKKFKIKPGKTGTVKVKISRVGRKLIARKHKLKARVTIKSRDSAKQSKTKHATVVLKPFRRTH